MFYWDNSLHFQVEKPGKENIAPQGNMIQAPPLRIRRGTSTRRILYVLWYATAAALDREVTNNI
jgi:hypothetical protein